MKFVMIALLAGGCGSSKEASKPKLDCDAFAKAYGKAAGVTATSGQDVIQAAQRDCSVGGVTQAQFDCVMKATSTDALEKCDKLPKQ